LSLLHQNWQESANCFVWQPTGCDVGHVQRFGKVVKVSQSHMIWLTKYSIFSEKSSTFWAKKSSTFVVFLQQAFRLTGNARNAIIQA
jgi:hypothetical protein